MLKKLHIFEFNRYKVKKHKLDIPEKIENIRDLHDFYKNKTKQLCEYVLFYINNGNILKETTNLIDIDNDIILINIMQSVRFSNHNELINNATDNITSFLNNVFTNSHPIGTMVNSSLESTTPHTFSVYEEELILENIQTTTMNNTLIHNISTTTPIDNNAQNNINSLSNTNNIDNATNNIDNTTNNINPVLPDLEQNRTLISNSLTVNDELSEVVNIITNLSNNSVDNISNLSNNLSSSGQIIDYNDNQSVTEINNNTTSYSNIRQKYIKQFDKIISMGFTDEKLILMSLNLAEGNVENAINLYLTDYQA